MKTLEQIQAAHDVLDRAARIEKNRDREIYEVVGNLAMALRWVLDLPGSDMTENVVNAAKLQHGG